MKNQDYYLSTYKDFTIEQTTYIHFEETMMQLSYREDLRLVDGEIHSFIGLINLN